MNGASDLFNIANNTPAVVGTTGSGAISGGLLRPGSIDQQAFLQMMRAQQESRAAAESGDKPVAAPSPPIQNGIPTLTSAQFAALVGKSDGQVPEAAGPPSTDTTDTATAAGPPPAGPPGAPVYGSTTYGTDLAKQIAAGHAYAKLAAAMAAAKAGDGSASHAAPAPVLPASALPRSAPMRLSGAAQLAAMPVTGTSAAAATDPSEDQPRIFRGPAGVRPAGVQGAMSQAVDPEAADGQQADSPNADTRQADGKQADAEGQDKVRPSNPNLVHLKEQPDRDMQMKLRLAHKQWVVDETPGSRQLFFGADGKFGWDDFLDVINPLQHIPIVAQIYRAVTGDQINGAAELIGAIPLGPIGFLGMAGAIADLAVKDTTGKDIGDNVAAAIFGDGGSATDNMAAKPGSGSPSGTVTADDGSSMAATQTASIDDGLGWHVGIQRGRPG
jgi:hypothetical protein